MTSSNTESKIIRDKEIAVGEAIPSDLVSKTVFGRTVNISKLSKSNPVVMIFVPGYKEGLRIKLDVFWGCTPESCAFRSARDEFSERNVSVFILTGQSKDRIMDFIREKEFVTDDTEEVSGSYFTIIPDYKLTITKGLGVGYHSVDDEEFANRETLIIYDGRLVKHFKEVDMSNSSDKSDAEKAKAHVGSVLDFILSRKQASSCRFTGSR